MKPTPPQRPGRCLLELVDSGTTIAKWSLVSCVDGGWIMQEWTMKGGHCAYSGEELENALPIVRKHMAQITEDFLRIRRQLDIAVAAGWPEVDP
jgi:hypothetical protein